MVKTVLGAKLFECQRNWVKTTCRYFIESEMLNIDTVKVFRKFEVAVLYRCFLLNDRGEKTYCKGVF